MFILTQSKEYLLNTDRVIDIYSKKGCLYATAETAGEECSYFLGRFGETLGKQALMDIANALQKSGENIYTVGEYEELPDR